MELPQTREEWREVFKDGLPFEAVRAAHECGLMRNERYAYLFAQHCKASHPFTAGSIDPVRRDSWRCFWEPQRFPGETE